MPKRKVSAATRRKMAEAQRRRYENQIKVPPAQTVGEVNQSILPRVVRRTVELLFEDGSTEVNVSTPSLSQRNK